MNNEIESVGVRGFNMDDAEQTKSVGDTERYTYEWIWNSLAPEQRRVLVAQAFNKLGYEFKDTIDYTVLEWKDFPHNERLSQLQRLLGELINEVRPDES